jgi:hypothetical protein
MTGVGNAVYVCPWCDDVDAVFAAMLGAGGQTVREPRDFQGKRLRNGWMRHTGGNLVEVVQQRG